MKKLLIVVDYQNDSVIGSMGFLGAQIIEQKICEKITAYKALNGFVAFTLDTHYGESYEKQNHCEKQWGWQLYGRVKNLCSKADKIISKHTCASLDLIRYLIAEQFDSVELCGVVTNICVLSNAVLAKTALPDAEIIIDADCVASDNDVLHKEALDVLASMKIKLKNYNNLI